MGMLRPVLGWAIVMGLLTFVFLDQVLPRANARLRNLYLDIGRKKPTFTLAENVVNPVPGSQYFLRASRIEPGTGRLRSVSIYDVGKADRRRIIYADSGVMGSSANGRDMILRLFDGTVQQVTAADRPAFQHTAFSTQEIVFKDVADQLERSDQQLDRGDREMSTCELMGVVDSAHMEMRETSKLRGDLTRSDLLVLLGRTPDPLPPEAPGPRGRVLPGGYCPAFAAIARALQGRTDKPPPAAQANLTQPPAAPVPEAGAVRLSNNGTVASLIDQQHNAERRANRYRVEVHKKWSLAFAAIPFVLLAVVMALHFPRGGMGLVIGGGMFVYSIFYVGLTAGETLSDRGIFSPALAMWSPNFILGGIALIGLAGVNRQSGSSRGGGLSEWLHRLVGRPAETA
jgi:lipopolysaccharide export system permease protein